MNRNDRHILSKHIKKLEEVLEGLNEIMEDLEGRLESLQEHFSESPVSEGLEEEISVLDTGINDLETLIEELGELVP